MKNRKNWWEVETWWEGLQTRQDFIDVLPMYAELDAIMNTSLFMARKLAKQTKERYCIKTLKQHSNIPLSRIKEIVRSYEPNYLDLTYARFMFLDVCEDDGIVLNYMENVDYMSDEEIQVMMYLEFWDSL